MSWPQRLHAILVWCVASLFERGLEKPWEVEDR